MPEEQRSLWEVYHSETEPWKRGRSALISLGLFYFVLQTLTVASAVLVGNLDRIFAFSVGIVLFWLQFYFIWIGVHWVRWVWGGWNMALGFCWLIWGWRFDNGLLLAFGSITFLIGGYLCFSPSIHFFALRQRELVRWKESLLIAIACFFMLVSIGLGAFGTGVYREHRKREAFEFVNEIAQRVYNERDLAWALTHVTERSLRKGGRERLEEFFSNSERLGAVHNVTPSKNDLQFYFRWPEVHSEARVDCNAQTSIGPIILHNLLWDVGDGWRIERMWWTFVPLDEPWPLPDSER